MIERILKLERLVKWIYCKVKNGGIGGGIQSVREGDNITVDNTDPLNPIISSTGGGEGTSGNTTIPDWEQKSYKKDEVVHWDNGTTNGIWRSTIDDNNTTPNIEGELFPNWSSLNIDLKTYYVHLEQSEQYDFSGKLFENATIEYYIRDDSNRSLNLEIEPSNDYIGMVLRGGFAFIGKVHTKIEPTDTAEDVTLKINIEYITVPFNKTLVDSIGCNITQTIDMFNQQLNINVPFIVSDESTIYYFQGCSPSWELLSEVNKESSDGGDTDQENIIRVPSATYSELGITPESTNEEKQEAIATFLEGYENQGTDVLFFEIKDDVEYNFDVTSLDWIGINKVDFISILENKNILDIVVNDFNNTNGRIRCNISCTIPENHGSSLLDLSELNITKVNTLLIGPYTRLALHQNQISEFNAIVESTMIEIILAYNQIGLSSSPIISVPSSVERINLGYNQISNWELLEEFANNLHEAPSKGRVLVNDNITSANNTNFMAILTAKNWLISI